MSIKKYRIKDIIFSKESSVNIQDCLNTHFREFNDNHYTLDEILRMLKKRKSQVNNNNRLPWYKREYLCSQIDKTYKIIKKKRSAEKPPFFKRVVYFLFKSNKKMNSKNKHK